MLIRNRQKKKKGTKSLLHICPFNFKVSSFWGFVIVSFKSVRKKVNTLTALIRNNRPVGLRTGSILFWVKGKSADIVTSWWDSIQGIGKNTWAQWHQFSRWFNSMLPCWGEETSDPWFTSDDSHAAPETMFPRLLANDEWSRLYSRPHWFDLCDRDPIKMAIKSTQPLYR